MNDMTIVVFDKKYVINLTVDTYVVLAHELMYVG